MDSKEIAHKQYSNQTSNSPSPECGQHSSASSTSSKSASSFSDFPSLPLPASAYPSPHCSSHHNSSSPLLYCCPGLSPSSADCHSSCPSSIWDPHYHLHMWCCRMCGPGQFALWMSLWSVCDENEDGRRCGSAGRQRLLLRLLGKCRRWDMGGWCFVLASC